MLPVPYFHVVFTLPPAAAEIAFQNKALVCGLLMRSATQALGLLAAQRPKARLGLIAVLHSLGQTLTHRPHIHCVVPGGGVALDGERWVGSCCRFAPCRRPSGGCSSPACRLPSCAANSASSVISRRSPNPPPSPSACALGQSPFVVYAKPPFGAPEHVLAYLGRYTHRTAIGNSRLVDSTDAQVALRYKNYGRGARSDVMRLGANEFLRRFLLHVLPDGFHRIRRYGFLAKGDRGDNLARVRELLRVVRESRESADPVAQTEKSEAPSLRAGDLT